MKTSRDAQLREVLVSTDLPEIADQVIALEQERELRARQDLRGYLGGLEHLNLRARVLSSQRVAAACAEEYDALLSAVRRRDACLATEPSAENPARRRDARLVRLAGATGVLATAVLLQPLAWLGAVPAALVMLGSMALCVAGELFPTAETLPRKTIDAWWPHWVVEFRRLEAEAELARGRWRHAMAEQHVRPLVREFLERALREPSRLKEVTAPGLRHVRDTVYLARTKPVEQFLRAAERVGDGAIGLAGARGSGKSLLIESYLDGRLSDPAGGRRLAVRVSAPVQYEPRDFVLHLYATVCREVIALTDPSGRNPGERQWAALLWRELVHRWLLKTARNLVFVGPPTALVLGLVKPAFFWPAWVFTTLPISALLALSNDFNPLRLLNWTHRDRGGPEIRTLRRLAARRLNEIQFLQTRTSGWTGKIPLLRSETGWTSTTQRAQRPLTHPELVARFREFLEVTVRALGGTPQQAPRVLVGIDELDKIESAEHAQAFLNEIKGVIGVGGCQFLISVSEDALAAFERRGIPIRDAFDSTFDRVIQVSHIDYADACLLLERRIPTMPRPFMALCHCISGGVPRDLVRVARAMVDLTVDLGDKEMTLGDMCVALVAAELTGKAHAFRFGASRLSGEFDTSIFAWKLSNLPPEPAPRRLLGLAADLVPDRREVTAFTGLQQEAASFTYYCATLVEVFTSTTGEQVLLRTPGRSDDPASFDSLAGVRQKLAVNPQLAWLALDGFRREWNLPLPLET